jgi:DNA invertase Pin-like site-specific DNA recombinase
MLNKREMTMERLAVVYIRVSTERQAQEGVSLDAQEAKCRAWCDALGYQIAGTFTDAGISGKRMDTRPGLLAALDQACRAKAALVVYSLSRLARSTRDALAISDRLDKAGADLVSLTEKIDTTTAAGKMVFRMLAVLSEFERDLISERTRSALTYKRSTGHKTGGTVPFGYTVTNDGRLIAHEGEQEALSMIRELRGKGYTLREICAELKRKGIQTKTGATTWHPYTVAVILNRAA